MKTKTVSIFSVAVDTVKQKASKAALSEEEVKPTMLCVLFSSKTIIFIFFKLKIFLNILYFK